VSGIGSSSASDNLATVEGLLADGPCGVGPLLKRLLLLGKSGPEPLARLASNWAVKAMPKNSAIPVRLVVKMPPGSFGEDGPGFWRWV
jgi:hypothetical protein